MSNIRTYQTNQTLVDFSSGTAGTYTLRGRSNYDLRDTVDRIVTVTGGGTTCTGCPDPKQSCCGDIGTDKPPGDR